MASSLFMGCAIKGGAIKGCSAKGCATKACCAKKAVNKTEPSEPAEGIIPEMPKQSESKEGTEEDKGNENN